MVLLAAMAITAERLNKRDRPPAGFVNAVSDCLNLLESREEARSGIAIHAIQPVDGRAPGADTALLIGAEGTL